MADRPDPHVERGGHTPLEFPGRFLPVLVAAAGLYASYRIVQTALWFDPSDTIWGWRRIAISVADGGTMALLAPIALWASRTFPVVAPMRIRNVAAHTVIALLTAAGWIGMLVCVVVLLFDTTQFELLDRAGLNWLTSNVFAYALLVAILHAMALQHRLRQGELHAALLQTQLSTMRLESLRAQLRPHFLFNTLHTISELIHSDPVAADAMIIRLAHLLRVSLDYTAETEAPLRQELEVVEAYLDLHRMRFGNRLVVSITVAHGLVGALVPPMVLQPLVENSLRHGLTRRERGHIWVTADVDNGRLHLVVADDGVGLAPGVGLGVGITNTRTRLHQLYGEDQHFDLGPRAGGGAQATVSLPLRFALAR